MRGEELGSRPVRLSGKVAIVTGSSRGIGKTIALTMAKEGADVIVTARGIDAAEKVAEEIRAMGRRSMAIKVDVTRAADVENMVQTTTKEFKKIDILVNNAGTCRVAPLLETTEEEWDLNFNTNVKGVFLACKAVAKYMIKQGGGKIINISSCAGKRGWPFLSAYSASKFAVIGFSQSIASELAPYNITVNVVCPGSVPTPLHKEFVPKMMKYLNLPTAEAYYENLFRNVPLRRLQSEEDIAYAVVFLASDEANNITAQAINVDGGLNVY